MFIDYDVMSGTLGDIHMFDLINYPYTIDPWDWSAFEFDIEPIEVLGLREESNNTLSFSCEFYKPTCPLKW